MAAAASSSSSTSGSGVLPRVLVFDLDGCLWDPEMYELWGSGGSPFKVLKNGNLRDRSGTEVRLLGDVRSILHELKTDPKWKDTVMAVASTCDEPSWARECMQKFPIGDGHVVGDVFSHVEIYKASKARHLKEISKKTGVPLNEMIFYDNQMNNCHAVAGVGVTVMYTPDGVTRSIN